MKKLLLFILTIAFSGCLFAQERQVGPKEKAMGDSVCSCVAKLDLSKIANKTEATAAIGKCVSQHADLFMAVAEERKIALDDQDGLSKVGFDIGVNLVKNGCAPFIKISAMLADQELNNKIEHITSSGSTVGTLKRIENKGFNYFVITDANQSEKSFIWLRQFPGSEKFTNGVLDYVGKKVSIKWDELEVYIPAAKGYYKVKEVTELELQ